MKQILTVLFTTAVLLTATTTFAQKDNDKVSSLNMQNTDTATNPNVILMTYQEWLDMANGHPFARITSYVRNKTTNTPAFDAASAASQAPAIAQMLSPKITEWRQAIAAFEGNDTAMSDLFWNKIQPGKKVTMKDAVEYGAAWKPGGWAGLVEVLHNQPSVQQYPVAVYVGTKGPYPFYDERCGNLITPQTSIDYVTARMQAIAAAQQQQQQQTPGGGLGPGNNTNVQGLDPAVLAQIKAIVQGAPAGANININIGGSATATNGTGSAPATGAAAPAQSGGLVSGATFHIPGPPTGFLQQSAPAGGATGQQAAQPNQGIACANCPGASAWGRQDVAFTEDKLSEIASNTKTSKNMDIASFTFDRVEWMADKTGLSKYLNIFGGNTTTNGSTPIAYGQDTHFPAVP